ncbi:AraC family transcriptional regulator [Algoriphagus litoralis]|uniref:AraC family transcriptional regulator n=1 Tax=Algoriphagus litoralis TaxID=2202829 RepID=UPI000DB96AFD|nr:helix-turn-helix domain-containing protein [Algoriphagus litoralis]
MFFSFNDKSSLLFLFFVHGLIFFVLLLIKGLRDDHKPSLWLGMFTILSVLYIMPFMLGYANWYSRNPYRDILFYVPFQQLLILPPVIYFYLNSLLDRDFRFIKIHYLHFLPGLVYLIYSLVVFLVDQVILQEYFFYEDGRDKDFLFEYQAAGFFSLLIYLVLSLRIYKKYQAVTFNSFSHADSLSFRWAKHFLIALLVLVILRGLFFILNPEWDAFGRKFWYYFLFGAVLYYVSMAGYMSSIRSLTALGGLDRLRDIGQDSELPASVEVPIETEVPLPDDLEFWKEKIEKLIVEERYFENPELSVFDLAQKLETYPKKISQTINLAFEMNFNDYINQFRVKAVIDKIEHKKDLNLTLLGIALECGFNSKSTFNRAFKRYTGANPKEYFGKKE